MLNKNLVQDATQRFLFEEVTVNDLKAGYEKEEYTTVEVIQSFLNRIEHYEDLYNAFTFMNENALEEAKEIDRKRQTGEKLGPLAGIPIVIKEAVDIAGYPSTFGWAPLSKKAGGIDFIPSHDATIITRLKESGAIILGKTNIPPFSCAYNSNSSWKGPTFNAVDRTLTPGGSSSGTATAVSGNFCVLGIAEETAGSIQVPAAAQALVGIKPSFGLIPTTGVTPLAGTTRDVLGPHARTVQDAAALLEVIAGYDESDPKTSDSIGNIPEKGYFSSLDKTSLKGKRLGLYGLGWRNEELSKETEALYNQAIKELKSLGAEVVLDPFKDKGFAEYMGSKNSFIGMETFFYDLEKYLKNLNPEDETLSIKNVFEKVGEVPWADNGPLALVSDILNDETASKDPSELPDLREFNEVKTTLLKYIEDVMEEFQLDGFVYPQMPKPIPEREVELVASTTVSEINITGLPLITVPAGYYSTGSPFALAFFGEMWSEARLIGMAYAYEQATKHRVRPNLS
ncbi:aspartyl-tRNA(Asn) amidotransferase subunit A [Halalkalibacter wakoensis JCM 9140]|uniref:Aspartyl-tRNA(Asn) amidotransferase subunit A n=1 Tax=Halalkalibacter wakoensis JCM 9140 TaxID=1236970 RepID=W4Q4M3_9BACI|nr:aspartyl-tRNA(Asn) amidotransferase subunit A [Halalkalibacter wakoensis JCM 9140]